MCHRRLAPALAPQHSLIAGKLPPPISKRRGERDAGDEEQHCQEHAQDAARCFVYHLSSSFPLVVFICFIIPYCQGFFHVNFAENVRVLHFLDVLQISWRRWALFPAVFISTLLIFVR